MTDVERELLAIRAGAFSRPLPQVEYVVPIDPADETGCDSCQ
jgi:hypothetical protein